MISFMQRLAAWLRRRRWAVLAVWTLLVVAALPFASRQSEDLVGGGFAVPGSQSEQVGNELAGTFGLRNQLAVVLVPERGSTRKERVAAVKGLIGELRRVPEVGLAPDARRRALAEASAGRTALMPIGVVSGQQDEVEVARQLRTELRGFEPAKGSVTPHVVGRGAVDAAIQDISKKQLQEAELIGFPLLVLILLVIFGSLAAAALPVLLGAVAVTITAAAIYLLSQEFLVSIFAANMASMLGIGVAVDYSMFILVRYREEVRAGGEPDAAIARALSTSGVAIVFSGLTVIVSIAGLWLIDNAGLRSIAVGAIIVVATSVLVSAALLPVLLQLLGHRLVGEGRIVGRAKSLFTRRAAPSTREPFWERWTRTILKRPVLFAVAAAATLLVLAAPTLTLDPGENLVQQLPADDQVRVGYERAAAVAGPGAASPIQVLLRSANSAPIGRDAVASARAAIAADREVVRVEPPRAAAKGRQVLLVAIPASEGGAESTEALVRRLRSGLAGRLAARDVTAQVGGATAYGVDFQDQIFQGLWKIALFALTVTFVLLTVLLRSLILPLKAAIMNLLTVGAAYGVVVVVFQWGWVDGFLGFESKGSVNVFTMPLILATVFGLSMDYEIFLLSRIRERYQRLGDPTAAIAQGLAASAQPITGAALIMVAVFAVFIGTGLANVKELGLGLAVAIALDATLVRLVLVPSTMQLFGRWNWWLPRPLAALLDGPKGLGLAKGSAK